MTDLIAGPAGAALSRADFDRLRAGTPAPAQPAPDPPGGPLAAATDPEVIVLSEFLALSISAPAGESQPLVAPTKVLALLKHADQRADALGRVAAAARRENPAAERRAAPTPAPVARGSTGGAGRTVATTRSESTAAAAPFRGAAIREVAPRETLTPSVAKVGGNARTRTVKGGMALSDPPRRSLVTGSIGGGLAVFPTLDGGGAVRAGPRVRRSAAAGDLRGLLFDVAEQLVDIEVHTSPALLPHWGLRIDYEQRWMRRGYRRGRLLRSIPIAPSETVEVAVKSWARSTERRNLVEATERNNSSELTGEERWSLATAKEMVKTTSASINPSASVSGGVSLPAGKLPVNVTGNGNVGVSGSFSTQLTNSIKRTQERTQQQTSKSASSLKVSRTSTVELVTEQGVETTITERLQNPNTCRTLTYEFFEIVEEYVVVTVPIQVELILFLPLPVPAWTPQEVLCHSCDLRKLLPCGDYLAGIDAAKFLAIAAKRGVTLESLKAKLAELDSPNGAAAAGSPLTSGLSRLAELVHAFQRTSFPLNPFTEAPGDGGNVVDDLRDGVSGFVENLGKGFGEAFEKGKEAATTLERAAERGAKDLKTGIDNAVSGVQTTVAAAGEVLENAAETAAGVANEFAKAGQTLSGLGRARGISISAMTAHGGGSAPPPPELGVGSAIWWEVAQLAAPDLTQALEVLAARVDLIREMSGPAREAAEADAIQVFLAAVPDLNAEFTKIDVALALLASALIVGGAVAIGAMPGLGYAGVATAGAILVLAKAVDLAGVADILPDDNGLKALLRQTVARGQALADQTAAGGLGTSVSDAREQLEKQIQEFADAEVEFERLRCHLTAQLDRYGPVIWGELSAAQVQQIVNSMQIGDGIVEPSLLGYVGGRGVVRVVDPVRVLGLGFDWMSTVGQLNLAALDPVGDVLTLPTPGVTVEARLGQADACEEYVQEHRAAELRIKRAEAKAAEERAAQAKLESARMQQRLAQQPPQLDDPDNGAGPAIRVVLEKPAP